MTQQLQSKASVSIDKCMNCGKPLRPEARFCAACGTRVGDETPPPAAATPGVNATGPSGGPVVPPLEPALLQGAKIVPSPFNAPTNGVGNLMGRVTGEGLGEQPGPVTAQRTLTRLDRVAVVAKWTGALRKLLVDKNPASIAGATRQVMEMIAPFTIERDQFQNIMFANMIKTAQNPALLPAANATLALFPERFKQAIADTRLLSKFDTGGGAWLEIYSSWPYTTFQMTWDVPDNQLSEICIQTIYEGAFLLNPPTNGYLEEEEVRIENGLYPSTIKPLIRRAHAKCYGVDLEEWGDSADQWADSLTKQIAPFSHPGMYQEMQAKLAKARAQRIYMEMPASFEKLTDWELQQIHAFAKDQTYNRQEVLSMLINRWESLTGHVSRMTEHWRLGFQHFHFVLTMCLNMHSRRADPLHHKDYGNFLAQPGTHGSGMPSKTRSMMHQVLEEKTPHLTRCYLPEHESLFLLEYRVRRQMAVQAAHSAPSAQPSPMANPAVGQKHAAAPPPGGRPAVQQSDGTDYHPMRSEIPLTPEGAGVRQQGMDLVYELMLTADLPEDYKSTMAKLRALVSGNLTAFGLTEKRYREMEDVTFQQYLYDTIG